MPHCSDFVNYDTIRLASITNLVANESITIPITVRYLHILIGSILIIITNTWSAAKICLLRLNNVFLLNIVAKNDNIR